MNKQDAFYELVNVSSRMADDLNGFVTAGEEGGSNMSESRALLDEFDALYKQINGIPVVNLEFVANYLNIPLRSTWQLLMDGKIRALTGPHRVSLKRLDALIAHDQNYLQTLRDA